MYNDFLNIKIIYLKIHSQRFFIHTRISHTQLNLPQDITQTQECLLQTFAFSYHGTDFIEHCSVTLLHCRNTGVSFSTVNQKKYSTDSKTTSFYISGITSGKNYKYNKITWGTVLMRVTKLKYISQDIDALRNNTPFNHCLWPVTSSLIVWDIGRNRWQSDVSVKFDVKQTAMHLTKTTVLCLSEHCANFHLEITRIISILFLHCIGRLFLVITCFWTLLLLAYVLPTHFRLSVSWSQFLKHVSMVK